MANQANICRPTVMCLHPLSDVDLRRPVFFMKNPQADGTLEHVVEDLAVLQGMLRPVNGEEPKEKDDLVGAGHAYKVVVQ